MSSGTSHNQLDLVFPAGPSLVVLGRDFALEAKAQEMLREVNAHELGLEVRVEWNARLFSAAGRADSRRKIVSLNPRLREHDAAEIDRTLRHELAHLLAQFRAGRRRVPPHGAEWRKACHDLGIADEARCHTLPFPIQRRARRFLYRCERCGKEFPRVRRIKRTVACLDCCRKFNGGEFDPKARLRLVEGDKAS
jgi:predicted SprT family Zn-dependent metalloprotease